MLPVFLVSVLGSSVIQVGLIEGAAESIAMMARLFSGILSDRLKKRKYLVITGYSIGALMKPLFAIATSVAVVFWARFFDRLGKGIRGAPRDALIADVSPVETRGASYGIRQSLDTFGAFCGPFLALFIMILTAGNFRIVFWTAFIPGIIAVIILITMVHEQKRKETYFLTKLPQIRDLRKLPSPFKVVCIAGFLFTLSRFSEAFLLLRAQNVGVDVKYIPLFMVIMNLFYFFTSYPVGNLSDRLGRTGLMKISLVILIFSDLVLAISPSWWFVAVGTALWGLHMGFSQGLLSALVADTASPSLRGTAFGFFNLITGISLLLASVIAGFLWDQIGAEATFLAGALFAVAAFLVFTILIKRYKASFSVSNITKLPRLS